MKTKPRHIAFVGVIALAVAIFAVCTEAQSAGYLTSSDLTGVVPGNTYQFGAIDSINLGNGGVNLLIPLYSRPGRKITDQLFYTYGSKFWIVQPNYDPFNPTVLDSISWLPSMVPNGAFSGSPGAIINFIEQGTTCVVRNTEITNNIDSNFTITDGNGATYQFPNRHVWNSDGSNPIQWRCPGVNVTDYDVTNSSTGALQLNTTNFPNSATLTLKNGMRLYLPDQNPTPMSVEDTNGNFQSVTAGDTLKRTATFTYSFPDQKITVLDSNGANATYTTVASTSAPTHTDFPSSSCGGAYYIQYSGSNTYETASLSLPNGWTYTFTYDPNYGDLIQVNLPSGGYIKYDYTILTAVDQGPAWLGGCLLDSRRIAHRRVSATGNQSDEKVWSYAYSGTNGAVVTVTDPNGNNTVHTFNTSTGVQELSTAYQEGSTTIRTINNTWQSDFGPVQSTQSGGATSDYMNWRITKTTTTLNDISPSLVSENDTTYDSYTYTSPLGSQCVNSCTASYMNPTQVQAYDYGSGARGGLLQETNYTYLYSNSTYSNLHMMSQVTSKIIYDSTNSTCQALSRPCSQTTFEYDNYTGGIKPSGAVQHDSTFSTSYTTRGNLTATENWRSSDGSWLTTRNQYDDAGNVLSSSNPNGHSTGYGYSDSWANTSCVPSGGNAAAYLTSVTNALNQVTSYKYNFCQGTTASTTDANSETTAFTYDGMNRITQEAFPDGGQTTYAYNDPSLPLSITSTELLCNGGSNCPAQHRTITTILDGLGRTSESQLTSITPPVYADTYYDGVGNVSEVTNPYYYNSPSSTDGNTQYLYDVLGRVTQVTAQDGNVTTTTYSGNCATTTDPVGAARKACSDGLGRTTQVFEDPLNSNYETDYSYDALDNLLQVQQKGGMSQPSWRTRTFAYDSVSELLCSSNSEIGTTPTTPCPIPDGGSYTAGTTRYSYDYDGNVLSKISPAPNQTNANTTVTLSYSYDNLDRLLQKTSSDGTIGSYYLYDTADTNGVVLLNPIGRLSRSNTSVVESLHSYDAMGRVLEDMQTTPMHNQMAFLLTYTYDFIGDMTSYTNGMGYSFTQSFDGAARLTNGVTTNYSNSPSPIASNFMYVPTGAMTTMSLNNGNYAETRTYNSRLEPTEAWTYIPPDYTIQGNWLGYQNPSGKNNGNVYGWTFYSNYQGITAERSFTYDSLNRLSSMSSPGDTSGCYGLNWTYDPWGNRKTQTTTPGTGGNCPNFSASFSQNTNRMDDYSYDVAGNLLNDGTHSYTYDAENHLIKVDGGATATYAYDANGRRVETINSEGTFEKIYDLSGNVIADWNATGQMQGGWDVGYVYLFGRLAAVYEGDTTYFVGTDHLGSARALANPTGTIVDALNLLPFGEQLQGDTYTTHKFTGYERDTETGLDNAQARYYGSSMGRFMSPDPSGIGAADRSSPQGLNLYSYVQNNPLILTDPSGLGCVYLNDAGNGVEWIDNNSNSAECDANGGAWADGFVSASGVFTVSNSNNVLIANNNGLTVADPGIWSSQWNADVNNFIQNAPLALQDQINGLVVPGACTGGDVSCGSQGGLEATGNIQSANGANLAIGGLFSGLINAGVSLAEGVGNEAITLTEHAAVRLAERGISEADIDTAVQTAKASGRVITQIGKYGTPQLKFIGSNGVTVVVETVGRNAGKVISAW